MNALVLVVAVRKAQAVIRPDYGEPPSLEAEFNSPVYHRVPTLDLASCFQLVRRRCHNRSIRAGIVSIKRQSFA